MATLHSDGPVSSAPLPSSRQSTPRARTPRTRGPPSESAGVPSVGAMSDDEGFADDQVPVGANKPRKGVRGNVPRVHDPIGEVAQTEFARFLESFIDEPGSSAIPSTSAPMTDKYYVAQVHGLRIYNLSTLYVDYTHLSSWGNGNLSQVLITDYYRLLPFFTKALHYVIAKYEPRYFRDHRQPTSSTSQTGTGNSTAAAATSQSDFQGEKTTNQQTDKIFALAFYNLPLVTRVRHLRPSNDLGHLMSISGTVTRTSEVRPELSLATFVCEICRNTVPNVEQTFRYTEPTQCPNQTCNNREAWRLDIRQSTFVDWQKVRVQENSSEIPTGSMPRTIDVILRGEIVDRAKAGEKCIFTGALIVVPDVSQLGLPGVRAHAMRDNDHRSTGGDGVTGLKSLGVRDLTYRMAFLACMVTPDTSTPGTASSQQLSGQSNNILASLNQTAPVDPADPGDHAQEAVLASMTEAEINELRNMVHSGHIYSRLVASIAPMVYGHEIVKKGLLLQLMGGVPKTTPEGMQLRGDINVCIVGDPSTSKSQFLKYICSFLPRAVYTSGKASSAAGLTAAVVKDEETGEFTIEAGALMLADNGICCIDEFDKMDIADQVAIHEAMEQQTISIAKAGIQATLNARTSILAAANPVGGRYNRKTTLRANINMSPPIMSRFDLFFVILDECNESVDRHLAQHIVGIHQLRDEAVQPEFSTEQLQRYIRYARTFKPAFLPEARDLLVQKYKELRSDDAQGGIGKNSYRITVRQLESLIRLSEAVAKANCVEDVTCEFVIEAFNLLRQSIISVEKDDVDFDDDEEAMTATGAAATSTTLDADEDAPMDDAHGEARPAKTKVTAEKYENMVRQLVQRVDEDEMGTGEGVAAEALTQWYLEQQEGDLEDEAAYHQEKELVGKVLKRMVKTNILMAVRGQGLVGEADEADGGNAGSSTAAASTSGSTSTGQTSSIVYVLHPNYAVDD